jgi:alpha-tubulin suppressor-like RCC1 family protein
MCFRRFASPLFAATFLLSSCATVGKVQLTATTQRFVALSAGGNVTCGLTAEGAAWCWGDNDVGQLGASTNATCEGTGGGHSCSPLPVRVEGAPPLVGLSVGGNHACGLNSDGAAWCWGFGQCGQLGTRALEHCMTHRAKGADLACSRKAVAVQIDVRFRAITAGFQHTCALTAEGVAWCWGLNDVTQLGVMDAPDTCQVVDQPVPAPCSLRPLQVRTDSRFKDLAAGGHQACALDSLGTAWCWGGRSGLPAPLAVSQTFRTIAVGIDKACALDPDGVAWCWGRFALGPALQSTHGPRNMAGQGTAADVAAWKFRSLAIGMEHVCGLRVDGSIWCWGDNRQGQLGVFHGEYLGMVGSGAEGSNKPVRASAEGSFMAAAAGDAHTCALRTDGTVACWGRNDHGQLGRGSAD